MHLAAGRLRLEAATAEVANAFRAAGVQYILLKGAAIADWLYEQGKPRAFSDCDLLIRPADMRTARETLMRLGFEPEIDVDSMPQWWLEHGLLWTRRQDAAGVDVHHTLSGAGVNSERLWEVLAARRAEIFLRGAPIPVLSIPGRALHLALHAAQHGGEWGIKLEELELALDREGEATWRAAAAIAAEIDARAAFATGLRMVPAGRALADRLELATAGPADVQLRATSAPPLALGFDQLSRAKSLRARFVILRHKVFPPPTFMRKWSPRARRGRGGLLLAYAWRPVWLVLRAPAGLSAWRRARKQMRLESEDYPPPPSAD